MSASCRPQTTTATRGSAATASAPRSGAAGLLERESMVQTPAAVEDAQFRQDVTLDGLLASLACAPGGPVYPYVVASVDRRLDGSFAHHGSGPNLKGGVITLCTCKHMMRSYSAIRSNGTVWVAGVTPGGTVQRGVRHLFYLMRVGARAQSHAELWRILPEPIRAAKSATTHLLGDVFEPLDDDLRGPGAWDPENYVPPRPGHSHDNGSPPSWHRDISASYNGQRPALLVGDPDCSFVWNRPLIRLHEAGPRLPRNPMSSTTLTDFLRRLAT